MRTITIGFYGMTHLGLVSAVAAASKDCQVIAYDANQTLIDALKKQNYPIEEPNFRELMAHYTDRIEFTSHLESLKKADLIYVAIDVPTDDKNTSHLQPIADALYQLSTQLNSEQMVVVLSQIPPGFTRKISFPQAQLFYQVETLIFGRAVERASKPERLIVGCADPSQPLPSVYRDFLSRFNCPILTLRYESAELAKIAINFYLVSSVMTSNLLADVASTVGAEWQEITPTLRLDQRIGPYAYLDPGLGISGGNLERDMMTIHRLAQIHHVQANLIDTWLHDSDYYKNWVWRCLKTHVLSKMKAPTIAILGLAYKANTHSTKNSPSMSLIERLKETHARLQLHDPVVKHPDAHASAFDALNSADVLVIMTPWSEYSTLTVSDLSNRMREKIIIDPFRVLKHSEFIQANFLIYTLGVNLNREKEVKKAHHV